MLWIPFLRRASSTGWPLFGYRNFECPDAARNIVPWGILIGGEELHNNHHLSELGETVGEAVEFDIGWMWITCSKRSASRGRSAQVPWLSAWWGAK
jgi:stearoyl-CoA desaturase (delta-9 desaturase)